MLIFNTRNSRLEL